MDEGSHIDYSASPAGEDWRVSELEQALNTELMTETLGPLLLCLARPGSTPIVEHAQVLAYRPGKRGVIRYAVAVSRRGASRTVLGKLYAESGRAAQVYRVMKSLWQDVFADTALLSVPQPLGFMPDLSMLVYLPAEGQFLDEVIATDQACRYMELAGFWLSTLHRHCLPLEKQFQLAMELANVQQWVELVGRNYPGEVQTAARILEHLRERANDLQFETQAPIHKDFYYRHVIVNGELNVIDFDEMRLGDPNLDLAHFCANLYLLASRKGYSSSHFSSYQRRFLDAYAQHTGWTIDDRFGYFYAYTCLKVAKQLCNATGPHPRPEGEEQRRQVRLILEAGLMALQQPACDLWHGSASVMPDRA